MSLKYGCPQFESVYPTVRLGLKLLTQLLLSVKNCILILPQKTKTKRNSHSIPLVFNDTTYSSMNISSQSVPCNFNIKSQL